MHRDGARSRPIAQGKWPDRKKPLDVLRFPRATGGLGRRARCCIAARQARSTKLRMRASNHGLMTPFCVTPQLSFLQFWYMCFGYLGIQFGFALQTAIVSRFFQTLGADMGQVPGLWIAA